MYTNVYSTVCKHVYITFGLKLYVCIKAQLFCSVDLYFVLLFYHGPAVDDRDSGCQELLCWKLRCANSVFGDVDPTAWENPRQHWTSRFSLH